MPLPPSRTPTTTALSSIHICVKTIFKPRTSRYSDRQTQTIASYNVAADRHIARSAVIRDDVTVPSRSPPVPVGYQVTSLTQCNASASEVVASVQSYRYEAGAVTHRALSQAKCTMITNFSVANKASLCFGNRKHD